MNGDVQGRTALVLYGTETGNAQDLAEELARVTERLHFSTTVAELDAVPITLLNSYQITIFAISTTGQGEFPSNAKGFWTSLLKKRLPPTLLQHVQFFLVGLGDTSYPKFNWAARKLGKRLQQLGACEVIESCEADEQGEESTEGAFLAWLPLFKAALLENFPLRDGLKPIPDEELLSSKWILQCTAATTNGSAHNGTISTPNGDDVEERQPNIELSIDHADHDFRPIPDSFQVVLEENKRLTPSSHWQDVRLLTLKTHEDIDYLPGDALSILPKIFTEDVSTLLQLMDWNSIADTSITFTPTSKFSNLSNYPSCPIPFLFPSHSLTLRSLLTNYLDITSIPRRSLFSRLALYTNNPTHRDRLLEFTLPQYLDEYYDYATRPRRSILEILQEFDSIRIPWWEAASVFPLLRGRQFSIASGGALKRPNSETGSGKSGTKFELLIAIVKYRTVIKKTRQGVCTRYLAALAPGSTLNVIHRTDGRFFPASSSNKKQNPKHKVGDSEISATPRLLIGAGTGIAPLRALILSDDQQRRLNNDPQPKKVPTTLLFFGARNASQDFFFENEWAARLAFTQDNSSSLGPGLAPEAEFRLITAFSRDHQEKEKHKGKIYVQDRLREHAALVSEMVEKRGATVVVCGSAGAMPRAVRRALVDVLVQEGEKERRIRGGMGEGDEHEDEYGDGEEEKWTQERAEQYLDVMEKSRRYLQETW
jgi:sulfite reductase alpha subunit-like flavoprotein